MKQGFQNIILAIDVITLLSGAKAALSQIERS